MESLVNNELLRMCEEVAVLHFKLVLRHFPRRAEVNIGMLTQEIRSLR
jgi:hypothetical protein